MGDFRLINGYFSFFLNPEVTFGFFILFTVTTCSVNNKIKTAAFWHSLCLLNQKLRVKNQQHERMKVSVSIDELSATSSEIQVLDMLRTSMEADVATLQCPHCAQESEVIIHFNRSKFFSLRPEVKACCPTFAFQIEKALAIEA